MAHSKCFISPGIPAAVAPEYAALLQEAVNQLLLEVVDGENRSALFWPALYMGEMAKAIIDDLAVGLKRLPGTDRA